MFQRPSTGRVFRKIRKRSLAIVDKCERVTGDALQRAYARVHHKVESSDPHFAQLTHSTDLSLLIADLKYARQRKQDICKSYKAIAWALEHYTLPRSYVRDFFDFIERGIVGFSKSEIIDWNVWWMQVTRESLKEYRSAVAAEGVDISLFVPTHMTKKEWVAILDSMIQGLDGFQYSEQVRQAALDDLAKYWPYISGWNV